MRSKTVKGRMKIARVAVVCLLTVSMLTCGFIVDGSADAATSPYIKGTYTHRYPKSLVVNGVDISEWQDRGSLKTKNVDFAILRVSYTSYGKSKLTTNPDSDFSTFFKEAKASGIMTGVYVFSQATTVAEGKKEAQYAIDRLKALGIGPKDLSLPLYMDYEFAGGRFGRMYGISRLAATNAAVSFCNTVKAAGYTPGIYGSTLFFKKYIALDQLAPDVDIWCAQYYDHCTLDHDFNKWQYTSSARVKGISGKVDADFWYIDKTVPADQKMTIKGINKFTDMRLSVYDGSTKLKLGTDYNIGKIGTKSGYAYIKGIGKYAGYALVPLNGSSTKSVNTNLNKISANYLTYASDQLSKYLKVPKVVVKATKIKKLKGKKKKFYVKVVQKAKANASGYQVKYSRNSDMTDYVIKNIGKKYNKTAKNISTNARKRYYYVQVRTYKDSGGIRYYSSWSKVKKVWVK